LSASTDTNDSRVCEHRHNFLFYQKTTSYAGMENFICILVTVMMSDMALQNSNGSHNVGDGSTNRGAGSQDGGADSGILWDLAEFNPWFLLVMLICA